MEKRLLPAKSVIKAVVVAGKKVFSTDHRLASILAGEGVLFTLILTLCNNNNNLFATRLGASSYQLGLIASLPPLAGLICLIPFAIITDRMRNKKSMVMMSVLLLGMLYFVIGWIPSIFGQPVPVVIALLIAVNLPLSLYGSSWQSFFSDVARPELRNEIFAHRTKMNTVVGILSPMVFGMILTAATGYYKITVHQIFYLTALPLALGQVLLLTKVEIVPNPSAGKFLFRELTRTAKSLFSSSAFLGFLGVAVLSYVGWQMDWSVYFLAQFHYLHLNEVQLSLVAVLSALTQFLTINLWSRLAASKGVRFVFIIGVGGFAFCSLVMLFSLMMPLFVALPFYFIFHCIGASAFSAFQFTLLLCLLEVIPNTNKTLTIAIYSTVILISNAIMPFFGVHVYNLLGENKNAMIITILIVAFVRVMATFASVMRWRRNRGRDTLI
ncbi:MAG: MFS transporter [Clostridiaceae bacterium]|nr:MFS transporter [Clostridiaceae bacterium]